MKRYPINIKPFGQQAVLIEWPNKVEEAILDNILHFKNALNTVLDNGWELIPAYNSLAIVSAESSIGFNGFKEKLLAWYQDMEPSLLKDRYLYKFPVCYDMEFGIDLEEVSQRLNLSVADLIKAHCTHQYTVYGIGFLPGFMYLGGLPKSLEVPRRNSPRQKVIKGAVGLAAKQTGIYPQDSPGGWNIIGNCPIPIFKADAEEPCMVKVGDKIQFFPISRDAYKLHKIEGEVGIYSPKKTMLHD